MAKAGASKPGPSKMPDTVQKPKGRPFKVIEKTADLLRANEKRKRSGKGKGKEKEVLGDLATSIEDRQTLPGGVQVEKFAETRALEILALQNAIKTAAALGSTRAFQSLPRHLRRRAASHNPRRVPKRYRSRAAAEIQPGDNIAKLHRKRAKLRAKGNLRGQSRTEQLLERQRNKAWLPTHIWHAKRFHMTNIWGYRLPRTPTLKSFRPAYRAAARKAIVNDTSYFSTIELSGSRDDLVRLLARIVVGPFGGPRYESGARAAQALLYADDTYPHDMIGPVEIVWKPIEDEAERTIWLRVHPSIHTEINDVLAPLLSSPEFQDRAASSSTSLPNPVVQLKDLTSEIDSFEIMGPKSARILRRILRLVKSEHDEKTEFFHSLKAVQSGEISEGLIAGLLVHDPRLIFPAPMLSAHIPQVDNDGVLRTYAPLDSSSSLARSRIWDTEVREALSTPRYKKSDLDRRRHKLGLPGTPLRPTPLDNRIPLLLIQKSLKGDSSTSSAPGSDSRPISGFTLLVPKGWSMYLLSSFVYAGCMIGGLVERRNTLREVGVPSFPEYYGDVCRAGRDSERVKAGEEKARWEKKPPAKRPNFSVMGTTNPWAPDWTTILSASDEETATNTGDTPLRPWLVTGPIRRFIHALCDGKHDPQTTLLKVINAFRQQREMSTFPSSSADTLYTSALVHVRLEIECRGSPGDMAIVYSLSAEEKARWLEAKEDDSRYGRAAWDLDEPKSEMQRLGEIVPDRSAIIGYTSTGNYSLSRGHGFALAAISLKGYVESGKIAGPAGVLVKVQNRDGIVCRLARVELV